MRFPQHTSRIIDKYGILWSYDSKTQSWIDMGYVDVYTNVSETNTGLVYPELFEVLESIDPDKFNGLRISDNTLASFYYINSSDKTIKFKYEENLGERFIRIEVNNSLLSKKFREIRCVGGKGQKGDKGQAGISGIVAPNEKTYKLDIDKSGLVKIEVPVATPIDTAVSLRIFRSQEQIGEFLIQIDGEITYTFLPGYSIKEGTVYDIYIDNDVLYGNFELSGDLTGTWTYKVRQTGPRGYTGKDGSWFIGIDNLGIEDDNLRSNTIIYEMYKDADNNLVYAGADVVSSICANGFVADDPKFHKFVIEPTGWPNPTRSTLLPAAKYSTANCRDIANWKYTRPVLTVPDIKLPQWTPTENCPSQNVMPTPPANGGGGSSSSSSGGSSSSNGGNSSSSSTASVPTEQNWTVPGTYMWKIPDNVKKICVAVCGAGAGGTMGRNSVAGIGGGGGGLIYVNGLTVIPGETIYIYVGEGGAPGREGGSSTFKNQQANMLTVMAMGGSVGGVISPGTGRANGGVGGGCILKIGDNPNYNNPKGSGVVYNIPALYVDSGIGGNGGYTELAGGGEGLYYGSGGGGGAGFGINGVQGQSGRIHYVDRPEAAADGGASGYGTPGGSGGSGNGGYGGGGGGGTNLGGGVGNIAPAWTSSFGIGRGGGICGGGGGGGRGDSGSDPSATYDGGVGGNGAVRVIWGQGKSFPGNMD